MRARQKHVWKWWKGRRTRKVSSHAAAVDLIPSWRSACALIKKVIWPLISSWHRLMLCISIAFPRPASTRPLRNSLHRPEISQSARSDLTKERTGHTWQSTFYEKSNKHHKCWQCVSCQHILWTHTSGQMSILSSRKCKYASRNNDNRKSRSESFSAPHLVTFYFV